MDTAIRVLHLDSDSEFLELSVDLLEEQSERLEVYPAGSVDQARETLADVEIDCLISEFTLPETTGLDFLETARQLQPNVPFILFTGAGSEDVASEAISAGVTDYLQKSGGLEQFTLLANRVIRAVEASVARQRVQRREQEYRTLVDAAPVAIIVLDSEAEFLYANSSAATVVGVENAEQLLGDSAGQFLHPDDRAVSMNRLEHVFTHREPVEPREYRILDADNELRYVRGNIVPVTFDGDQAAQLVLVDITERKRHAEMLERYQTAVEVSGDAIYALDDEGHVQMLNERYVQFFGTSREDAMEEHVSAIANQEAIERGTEIIRELLRDDDRTYATYEFEQERNGKMCIYENTVSLIRGDDGEFEGSVGIIRDSTERKETERQLKRQNERLDKFASVVSHDLRNPLNVAELRLDLAQQEFDSDDLDQVEQAHDRMRTLVENVLTLARKGDTVNDPGVVAVESVAETCWRTTDTDGAALVVETDSTIRADETRLRSLFENLFRNSVEHAGRTATITVGELDGRQGLYVTDDGPGIPAEMRDQLFEFGATSEEEGTGFGLAIVREIAEAHGWEITATDGDDGGARFELTGIEFVD
jgi:PAS domain S-box-containing protein